VAVLLLIATFGVIARLHETTAESALFALTCVLLFGLAYSLDNRWTGTTVAGLALGAAALSRGVLPAAVLGTAAIVFVLAFGSRRAWRCALLLLLALAVFALWPAGAMLAHAEESTAYFSDWWRWNLGSVGVPAGENVLWLLRNVGWYAWPLWPFALWTIYSWRHYLRRPHIALPLLFACAGLVATLVARYPSEREFLLTIPALVILAAFGVSSLKRTAEDAIDWFSLALFTLALAALWLYFIAWNTGLLPKMAASVARLTPGFTPDIEPWPMTVALAATLTWCGIVAWRVRARPPMMWTGPFIAASGLSMVGLAAIALSGPAIDYARSYASLAPTLAEQVRRAGGDTCVQAVNLPTGVRAMLAFHGGIRFERPADAGLCRVALQRDSRRTTADDAPPVGAWTLAYDVTRRARFDEAFRIWVRAD
jgi:4-amino-4-deoxy-L-arabinose transferase-like glycosyltransferase